MKLKLNYFVIPLLVFGVAAVGTVFTTANLATWYKTLTLPSFAPAGQIIGLIWTTLYVMIAASIIYFWNNVKHDRTIGKILVLFAVNGFLNAFWSFVFFGSHLVYEAIFVSAAMALTIYLLVYLILQIPAQGVARKSLRTSAYLLIPYAAWVTFATYLNYVIFSLNK